MRSIDVVIMGLGVHGSAAARELAARGHRVLGVEPSAARAVTGASRGPLRMLREADPSRPELNALAQESAARWRQRDPAFTGTSEAGFFRSAVGVLITPSRDADRWVGRAGDRLREIAPGDALLAGLALGRDRIAMADDRCALLDAGAAVRSLRSEAAELGAELRFGSRIRLAPEPPTGHGRLRVRVLDGGDPEGEDVTAERLLVCVGARTRELPAWAGVPGLRIEPAPMQIARFASPPLDPRRPRFHITHEGDDRFCLIPMAGGDVQFGHFEQPAGVVDPMTASRARDLAALRRYLPGTGPLRRLTTVPACYTAPPAGDFVLRWGTPRTATLVACSGVGFKFAPAVAVRVAAALEGQTPHDGASISQAATTFLDVGNGTEHH
ncbi:NAD(P)/FAD-dependent oxidoreductase [Streptomyces sp. 900105755]